MNLWLQNVSEPYLRSHKKCYSFDISDGQNKINKKYTMKKNMIEPEIYLDNESLSAFP